MRQSLFGSLKGEITENKGVKGVEIVNDIGERAVLANNEAPSDPTK